MKLFHEETKNEIVQGTLTNLGLIVTSFLFLTLLGLIDKIIYDISIAKFGEHATNYFTSIETISLHALIVIPLFIVGTLAGTAMQNGRRYQKLFSGVFFTTSVALVLQLLIQIGLYFYNNHTESELYIILGLLAAITTLGIYFIVNNTGMVHKKVIIPFMVATVVFLGIVIVMSNYKGKAPQEMQINNGSFSDTLDSSSVPVLNVQGENGGVQQSISGSENQEGTTRVDTTPRIMYWPGKVNQHFDFETLSWQSDPDGKSGADIDRLSYCQKFYPDTITVEPYRNETIHTWKNAGNYGSYTNTLLSYRCVQQ